MSFMKEVLEHSREAWLECFHSDFVTDVATDKMSEEVFKHYMVQDTLYLKEYARSFAIAMYRASSLEEMKVYYSLMSFVNESEGATRLVYLNSWGISPEEAEAVSPTPVTKAYCDFMLDIAKTGDAAEILMATLPCTLSYYWVWKKVVEEYADIKQIKYWDMVADYTIESFGVACEFLCAYVDRFCADISEERKEHLKEIFYKGSVHEIEFWKMSSRL